MAAEDLTPAEVTELCKLGLEAWEKLGPRQYKARFSWRGRTYIATHTALRLLVHNAKGEPVACRYD